MNQTSPSKSITSALDLQGSQVSSPSLGFEADHNRLAKRRSWGRLAARIDPDFDPDMLPSTDDRPYNDDDYSEPHVGTSTQSLIRGHFEHEIEDDNHHEDDQAHLTSNMSRNGTDTLLLQDDTSSSSPETPDYSINDPEIEGGSTPRTRRRTQLRYSVATSPLKKTETAIKSVSKNFKRISLRVVNLANTRLEGQLRLGDGDGDGNVALEDEEDEGPPQPDLKKVFPIRGRALCFLGPESKIRLAFFDFLVHPMTEPMILLLIILNAVVLTIQAFQSLTLPASASTPIPPPVKGYFHTWEDYALFVLFIIFTLEAFARICVNGFLFDPQVFIFGSSSSTLPHEPYTPTPGGIGPSLPAAPNGIGMTEIARQTTLNRGHSLSQRFKRFRRRLLRPFALATRSPPSLPPHFGGSEYPYEATPIDGFSSAAFENGHLNANLNTNIADGQTQPSNRTQIYLRDTSLTSRLANVINKAHATIREPSEPTYLSRAMRSDALPPDNPKHANGRQTDVISLPFRLSISHLHSKTQRNVPYLRQSWTRIDFLAIVCFWIMFGLATSGLEHGGRGLHLGVFRAISVIRTARLLSVTSGTTTIMHSLKTARPLLTSVAYFVLFAMVLFSIIGVQSFKGSLRRTCFISPTLGETSPIQLSNQFCGGYIDPNTLEAVGYLELDGTTVMPKAKGYVCPLGLVCTEGANPESNIQSFDAIYYAALQVIVVAGANGWSPLMYSMIDAEYFVSCFFFIIAIIVLNFWLINLFVAVITNSFSAIRSETHKSAFGAAPLIPVEKDDGWLLLQGRKTPARSNIFKNIYSYTSWIWVILALTSLVLQATRTVTISPTHALILYYGELVITSAFDAEIVLRVLASLPEWRRFFEHGNNWIDGVLAIACTIIQIPVIRDSSLYPWFTIFQLARFYRVILVIPRMKPLLLSVFGNMYGLANMALFLMIVNYIAALVAVQLLRGDFSSSTRVNFGDVWNSFLAMYQVFSSENWPNVLYGAATNEVPLGQTVLVLIFISAWFLFANFIVLQMFIAVINENFQVAEEQKKSKQTSDFYSQQKARHGRATWLRRLNPYRWIKANPVTVKVDNLPSNLVLPMQKVLIQDNSLAKSDAARAAAAAKKIIRKPRFIKPRHYSSKSLTALQQLFSGEVKTDDIPMTTLRQQGQETATTMHPLDEEMERHLELLASVNPDVGLRVEDDEFLERRAQKADFIRDHPSYDKVFWVIGQKNKLRQLCQKVVQPARGERIFGTPYSPVAQPIFQLLVLLTIIGGIVVEGIATPAYRRNFFLEHGRNRGAWFEITEAVFGFILLIEFLIKVIADGFLFTPNAYLKSIWNCLDFIIMIGIIVNVTTGLIFIAGLSRFTRSLKALRALKLITLIDQMRNTFQHLIISGAIRILDAAVLAILYMIPYAVWGLNIFNGRMNLCNDTNVQGLSDCINEYTNTVYGTSFGYPVPHVWNNPSPSTTFSFDSFRASLLILFEIVSFEGWIDVMNVATSITGAESQPQANAAQANAIFFVIYNLMGGVVILTLFVSIIIGNFQSKTGVALLTRAQREWIDLKKLFNRQKPSKRPKVRPTGRFRKWCYDRAVHKHGWWARATTLLFFLHILVLMTQTFSTYHLADTLRNDFFLALMFIYLLDVFVHYFGLGWRSFRANGWNLFDLVVASGSFITTIVVRFGHPGLAVQQLQKLFLVSIAFKLVQRTNSLNMLFKTAVASLPVILSLLGLWIVLFVFFAIMYLEVFGLTKWGGVETPRTNYYTLGDALVMLAFQSTGEGWNQYMHDFALSYPRCTVGKETDCGSTAWAYSLFISWNLLSMYIFANMFTGVVVENFSYVFQASGSGSSSISREQMRSFKKVWAQFSNQKTGYLERHQFSAFFAKLSGVFEVRIYPVDYNISNIVEICRDPLNKDAWSRRVVEGLDLSKLEQVLDDIDYAEVRKRKAVYSRLHHEASISHEQGLGISFTDMLTLLAHHKLIVDGEALVLEDLIMRNETNKLVTDLVNLDRVRSLLKTISYRRQFLAYLEKKRAEKYEKDIPSIVVENIPETPPMSSRDISSAGFESSPNASPSPGDFRYRNPDYARSVSMDLTSGSKLQRSGRRTSDYSTSSMDMSKMPRMSWAVDDPEDVGSAMQASVWDDLMLEVAEEEKSKRTF